MQVTHSIAILFVLCLLLSGCSLAPGSVGPGSKVTNKSVQNSRGAYKHLQITPELVKSAWNQKKGLIFNSITKDSQLPTDSYKIGIHDILSITVWDHPELTIPAGEFRSPEASGYHVQSDGKFFFPYAGYIHASGRTTDEIRKEIARKLSGTIVNPQVGVVIASFRSQRISVTGEINKPGILVIRDVPITVLVAVAQSGGMTKYADTTNLLLSRKGKVQRINFDLISRKGDLLQNLILKHGDSLHIMENTANKVFVMGEVVSPGAITYSRVGMTLAEAINASKGFKEDSVNPTGIFVIRQANKNDTKPTVYQLDASSVHSMLLAEQFNLRNRDIVYVTAADVTRWNRVISQILPTASIFTNSINAVDKL